MKLPVWRCALAIAALLFVTTAAQTGSGRTLTSPLAGSAIDRGLRAVPMREPRGRAAVRRAGESFIRGSVIVRFRSGTTAAARRLMLAQVEGTPTATPSYADFDVVSIDPAADPEAVARRLDQQPDVDYAQARYIVSPRFVPNDPLYPRQWNYPAIDMERAWDINPGATSDVIVAVIDSGIAYRNATFTFNSSFPFQLTDGGPVFPALGVVDVPFVAAPDLGAPTRFVSPRDFIWDDFTPVDLDGHGTHVSGTIGQATNNSLGAAGMAFNVRIMPVKVIASIWDLIFDSPNVGTDDVVARGVRYAVDNGAKVLNMSIGRTGPPAPVMQSAIQYAVDHGAFVVVAAGNDFEDGNPIERPADIAPQIPGMVAVGAIGRDTVRAFYSSTGSYVELAAPGGNSRQGGNEGGIIQQTYDLDFVDTFLQGPSRFTAPRFDVFAYEPFQGTSMAAPHVSGFAALLIQQGITSPPAIEAAMKRYATDLGASGRDDEYGYGLINPRAALRGMGLIR
jgi:serine protease